MRILLIGGTGFIGPHLARAALHAGADVTLFHRGVHPAPGELASVREVLGDRLDPHALGGLAHQTWDVVIDTSCYFPRAARLAAELLGPSAERYVLVSSVSAYADGSPPYVPEIAPLAQLADEAIEEVNADTYGGLKALCEVEVASRIPDRSLIIRPGILVGPGDPTGRFTYWCRRVARGGVVLAPGPPSLEVQYLDARDLATWVIELATRGATGVYNAAGPGVPLTMFALLEGLCEAIGSDARLRWVSDEFLLAEGVEPWTDLPLWIPPSRGNITADISRAVAAGLAFRPLALTAADTVRWADTQPPPGDDAPGLQPAREAQLLARYAG